MSKIISTERNIIAYLQLFDDDNIPQDNETIAKVKGIYNSILLYYREDFEAHPQFVLNVKIFSNTLVVSYLIKYEQSDIGSSESLKAEELDDIIFNSLLNEIIIFCSILNYECQKYEIPLRGVITEGTYFVNDTMIWGKGLVEAYDLFKKHNCSTLVFDFNLKDKIFPNSLNSCYINHNTDNQLTINTEKVFNSVKQSYQSYSHKLITNQDYLSDYVVAVVDILGAKTLIQEDENKNLNILYTAYTELQKMQKNYNDGYNQNKIQIAIFSDNIVIASPVKDNNWDQEASLGHKIIDLERALSSVIQTVIYFQCFLASEDILVRGGISYGKLFCDYNKSYEPKLSEAIEKTLEKNKILWGAPFLDADYIEKNIAKYPRVVVDRQLVDDIKKSCIYNVIYPLSKPKYQFDSMLHYDDEDKQYYVDYVTDWVFEELADIGKHIDAKTLLNLADSRLNKSEDNSIAEKNEWHFSYITRKTL